MDHRPVRERTATLSHLGLAPIALGQRHGTRLTRTSIDFAALLTTPVPARGSNVSSASPIVARIIRRPKLVHVPAAASGFSMDATRRVTRPLSVAAVSVNRVGQSAGSVAGESS